MVEDRKDPIWGIEAKSQTMCGLKLFGQVSERVAEEYLEWAPLGVGWSWLRGVLSCMSSPSKKRKELLGKAREVLYTTKYY